MAKANCWDVMHCHHATFGADGCPAYTGAKGASRLEGVHGGKNGGRACWAVAGTRCGGTVQGEFALKAGNCMSCEFYRQVAREEGAWNLVNGLLLVQIVKGEAEAPTKP